MYGRIVCLGFACLSSFGLASGQVTRFTGAAPANARQPVWRFVGPRGMSPGDTVPGQIAFAPNGIAHMPYKALQLASDAATVQAWDPGLEQWYLLGDEGAASVGNAWYNTLAFDAASTPYIVQRDYSFSGGVNVRNFVGGAWQNVCFPIRAGEAHFTRIALGPDGTPYISYQDRSTDPPDQTTVQRYDASVLGWSYVEAPGIHGASSAYQSLGVDSTGKLYVAFSDPALAGRATVVTYDQSLGDWISVGALGSASHTVALNLTLAIDPMDRLFVAYHVWHRDILVRTFVDGVWAQIGGPASGGDGVTLETEPWRQWLSLDFDAAGTPFVAYQLLADRRAAVRRFDQHSETWKAVGPVGFTPGPADYLSLAVDASGAPWVAFRDNELFGRTTVMRAVTGHQLEGAR